MVKLRNCLCFYKRINVLSFYNSVFLFLIFIVFIYSKKFYCSAVSASGGFYYSSHSLCTITLAAMRSPLVLCTATK